MARSTMADIITELRGMGNAGTADFSVAGVTFWDDDQLQIILDRNRTDVYRDPLKAVLQYDVNGDIVYQHYYARYDKLETTDGGTAILFVEDTTGAWASINDYSVNYRKGIISFNEDTGGDDYLLTARSYDLYGAAAEVWRQKATHYASSQIDWSTDNMSVKRSQVMKNALDMAEYYERQMKPVSISFDRGDITGVGWTKSK